jgi:hypothetical protein
VRIISRTDASLAISLVIATVTLFSQPLKQMMDTIAGIENEYHLAFLPALAVLSVAFAITQSRKRVETGCRNAVVPRPRGRAAASPHVR